MQQALLVGHVATAEAMNVLLVHAQYGQPFADAARQLQAIAKALVFTHQPYITHASTQHFELGDCYLSRCAEPPTFATLMYGNRWLTRLDSMHQQRGSRTIAQHAATLEKHS